jgi:hypothetical protein
MIFTSAAAATAVDDVNDDDDDDDTNISLTGNCVLMKPSEVSENVASLLEELFPKYFDTVSLLLYTCIKM